MNVIKKSFIPNFVFKEDNGTWHRMDEEKPFSDKSEALKRKREITDLTNKRGFRIVKHQNKYYLYERKD